MIWAAGVVLWSVAEASFFFIVPDVLLTAAALRFGLRRGLLLCVLAAACAALTGLAMGFWAARDPAGARAAMLLVPAVGPDLLTRVHREYAGSWPLHMLLGALSGVPYKLYAVEAGTRHIPPLRFWLASFFARLVRFALTALLTIAGQALLVRLNKARWIAPTWVIAWGLVYLIYFTLRVFADYGPSTL